MVGAGVVGVALLSAGPALVEQGFADRAVRQRLDRGLRGRVLQGKDVLARKPPVRGVAGCRAHLRVAEAGETRLVVHHQRAGLGRGQELLAEGDAEDGDLLVQRPKLGLVGRRKLRARAHEAFVIFLDEHRLLLAQPERGALIIKRLHTDEELWIKVDCVAIGREFGPKRGLRLLQRRIGVGLGHLAESQLRARQHLALPFHGDQGVVEGRRRGIVRDLAYFGEALRDPPPRWPADSRRR